MRDRRPGSPFLLSAVMALAVVAAACGTSVQLDAQDVSSQESPQPTATSRPTASPAPEPTAETEPTATPEPEPEPTATPVPDPTPTAEPAPTATRAVAAPGGFQVVEIGSYYRFVAPDDWVVLTDPADVEELIETGSDAVGMDPAQVAALAGQLDSEGSVVLLSLGGNNLNVLALPRFDPLSQEPADYAALLESQFASAGAFDDFVIEARHGSIGANEGMIAEGSYTLSGTPLIITQFIVAGSSDTFVMSITLTDPDPGLVQTILESLELL